MKIKEVSDISGLSVRTLHYYDKMGLLTPKRNSNNEYREYTQEDLETLQQILFFKECGFSLIKIKQIIFSKNYNKMDAFILQKKFLLQEKDRINQMIRTLDKTINAEKGVNDMQQKEMFGGFNFENKEYSEEAKRLWGEGAVLKTEQKIDSMDKTEKYVLGKEMENIFANIAKLKELSPEDEKVQTAIKEFYIFLNSNFGYQYSLKAFAGLGKLYAEDERFTKNIDKFGTGLANFLEKAMAVFAESEN